MNRCIVYKRSFKLFHFTLVTPWQCKFAFGVCLVILENESAGIKCNDCEGASLMWLLDLSKTSAFPPTPFLCSPHHTDKVLLPFLPTQRSWLGAGSHRIEYRLCHTSQNCISGFPQIPELQNSCVKQKQDEAFTLRIACGRYGCACDRRGLTFISQREKQGEAKL